MIQRQVMIMSGSQTTERTIEFSESAPYELRLLSEAGDEIEFSCKELDLFDCLTTLRKQYLEIKECLILCNGARLDVYPSRMSRSMSGGRKAYITHLGQTAKRTDLVDIFDPVEDLSRVATVAEQKDFNKKWFESLG